MRLRRLLAAAMGAAVVLGAATPAASAATFAPLPSLKKSSSAGYLGSSPGLNELRATIVVPRVTCRDTDSYVAIFAGISTSKESALGEVEIDCLGKGRAQDTLFVYAGKSGAVLVPAERVHPGNRVRVSVLQHDGRLQAEASIAGRHQLHMTAKGGPVGKFSIGAFDLNPADVTPGSTLIRYATSDGKPIGAAADLVRTSESYHGQIVLAASSLRRRQSFVIRALPLPLERKAAPA